LSADLGFFIRGGGHESAAGVELGTAVLRGRWHGNVKSPNAEGHLEVTRLRLPGETQMAALSADVAANLGNAELHALVRA